MKDGFYLTKSRIDRVRKRDTGLGETVFRERSEILAKQRIAYIEAQDLVRLVGHLDAVDRRTRDYKHITLRKGVRHLLDHNGNRGTARHQVKYFDLTVPMILKRSV